MSTSYGNQFLPTAEFAKAGFNGLAESEKKLLSLICCKLLCAVAPDHVYEAVTAVFECSGKQFTAKGKNVLHGGWKDIDACFRTMLKGKSDVDTEDEASLPELFEGQAFDNLAASVTEH